MAEYALYSRSAFGRTEPFVETWTEFEIRESADLALASVNVRQGKTDDLSTTVRSAYGLLPPEPGRSATQNDITFYWMGQGQWFVSAARKDSTIFGRELADTLGETASVTDQSDAWVQLQVTGMNNRLVLEKLCPLDLHPMVFKTGSVARTVMEHIGVVIALTGDPPVFKLMTARSSLRSFLKALRLAAESTCGRSVQSR